MCIRDETKSCKNWNKYVNQKNAVNLNVTWCYDLRQGPIQEKIRSKICSELEVFREERRK